jgi:hypothetical protein
VPPSAEASTELAFSVTVPDELSYLATEFEALY